MSTDDQMQSRAMRLSLVMGFVMLVLKMSAYLLTGSAAILGDAAESVVHVAAVVFAAYSLWLAAQPAATATARSPSSPQASRAASSCWPPSSSSMSPSAAGSAG
jgi:hypothetical protein